VLPKQRIKKCASRGSAKRCPYNHLDQQEEEAATYTADLKSSTVTHSSHPLLHRMVVGHQGVARLRHADFVPDKNNDAMSIVQQPHPHRRAGHPPCTPASAPPPGSPLAPLTDSHHNALIQVTTILTTVASPPTPQPNQPPEPSPPTPLPTDPSLRVDPDTVATTPPIPILVVSPADATLKVPRPSLGKTVTFAPLPTPPNGATFANSTGAPGRQRRRSRRQSNASSAQQPAKTVHPNKLVPTTVPRVVTPHQHYTQSKHLQHVLACARALLRDDALAPQSPFPSVASQPQFALHSPNTANSVRAATALFGKRLTQTSLNALHKASAPSMEPTQFSSYTPPPCPRAAKLRTSASSLRCVPKKQTHFTSVGPLAATKSSKSL
jgi:hypothetical protein